MKIQVLTLRKQNKIVMVYSRTQNNQRAYASKHSNIAVVQQRVVVAHITSSPQPSLYALLPTVLSFSALPYIIFGGKLLPPF